MNMNLKVLLFLAVFLFAVYFSVPAYAYGVSDFVLVQQHMDSTGLSEPVITSMQAGASYRLYHDYNTVSCFVYCVSDTGLEPQYSYLKNYPVPLNIPLRYDFTVTIYSNVANDLSEYYELSLRLKDNTGTYSYPIDSPCPYYDKIFIEQGWTSKDDTDGFYLRFAGVYDSSGLSLLETRIGLFLEPYLDRSETYDIYITFNEWSVGEYSIDKSAVDKQQQVNDMADGAIELIENLSGIGNVPSAFDQTMIESSGREFAEFFNLFLDVNYFGAFVGTIIVVSGLKFFISRSG